MEELEQANNLIALNDEAQEALRKACEEQGINQEVFQVAVDNLVVLWVYTAEQLVSAITALRNALMETIAPALHNLSDHLQSIFNVEDLFFMVPPHIKHLANNHPKARVRNKNWNRMWKILERYMKCHKN